MHKRSREPGLGRWPDVALPDARLRAAELRKPRSAGIDPFGKKQRAKKVARKAESERTTFGDATAEFIKLRAVDWSENTRKSWKATP